MELELEHEPDGPLRDLSFIQRSYLTGELEIATRPTDLLATSDDAEPLPPPYDEFPHAKEGIPPTAGQGPWSPNGAAPKPFMAIEIRLSPSS